MSAPGDAPKAEAARLAAIATLDLDELKPTFERIGRLARAFAKLSRKTLRKVSSLQVF